MKKEILKGMCKGCVNEELVNGIMQTNDHRIRDYNAELDRKYGAVGTKEREQFEEEARYFYSK